MPHGKIAGFDRPLAESEIIVEASFRVDESKYNGRPHLEDDYRRSNTEDTLESLISGYIPSNRNMTIKIEPAGSTAGINIAIGSDRILETESGNEPSISSIKGFLEEVVSTYDWIAGFEYPPDYDSFGEMSDEPVLTIRTK